MPEELETAKTSIDSVASQEAEKYNDVVDGVADINEEQQEVNDVEFTDTKAEEDDDSNKAETKKPQTKEQNAEFAHKRREAETKAKIEKAQEETRIQTLIDLNDGVNPYTQEPMTDKVDVQKYLAMREIEKSGGDPVADYHKFQSKKQKEEIESQKKVEDEKQWYANDRKNFFEKHPEMNEKSLTDLLRDEEFLLYGEGKFGKVPLSEIYDGYSKVLSAMQTRAKSMAEKMYANRQSSPGSLNSSETSKSKSWSDMSDAEFETHIAKAKSGAYRQT